MICENCGMLTKPFNDGSFEFCGEAVVKVQKGEVMSKTICQKLGLKCIVQDNGACYQCGTIYFEVVKKGWL